MFPNLFLAGLAAVQGQPSPAVSLARLEARLFYMETGRLSEDLLARPKPFDGWNTIIGEGDAEEKADDLLVSARMEVSTGERHRLVDAPVSVVVRDAKGKLLGSRRWNHFLTSDRGVVVLPLWVNDATCAGEITIEGRFQSTVKRARLQMHCGE